MSFDRLVSILDQEVIPALDDHKTCFVDDRDEFAPVDGECLDGVFVFAEAQVVVLLSTHQAVPALFA